MRDSIDDAMPAFVGSASRRDPGCDDGQSRRDADPTTAESHLPALLQLSSAALPIGGFSYSGGLESAVEQRIVTDVTSAERWLHAQLHEVWARGEAAIWPALHAAWSNADEPTIRHWNDGLLAARDTAELGLESEQMGRSLALWLLALPETLPSDSMQRSWLASLRPIAHVCAHACAAAALKIPQRAGLMSLGWSLLENQVAAAVKLIPLGQDAGQHLLRNVGRTLDVAVDVALATPASKACNFAPMLGLLSARHEQQYSRLFRS